MKRPNERREKERTDHSHRATAGDGHGWWSEPVSRLLAELLEKLSWPVVVLDGEGRVRAWNDLARRQLDRDLGLSEGSLWPASMDVEGWEVSDVVVDGSSSVRLAELRVAGARLEDAAHRWKLTPRQAQVLAHLTEGLSNKVIAERLGVAENTIEFHVSAVLRKAGVRTRAELLVALSR